MKLPCFANWKLPQSVLVFMRLERSAGTGTFSHKPTELIQPMFGLRTPVSRLGGLLKDQFSNTLRKLISACCFGGVPTKHGQPRRRGHQATGWWQRGKVGFGSREIEEWY